ncbi:MSMEG_0565 family glycosyltransferase [Rathayibacter sp. VKM Ac-2760]|uniref:MSMEG_0565 family glycosyltransferase n=1 Tax=Rathayibacter sp. VKM Ac-2760 TaxID=2609253 RepID=UPI001315F3A0|nr:MSMEG_0565 family glycosyltransferase [Rathayibacter sp. VKM Ac-2760]QHC58203.1 MSMEG_0565 family glycosyltransferase [Rathayibacter sp. VKM Ac-2760]
MRIAQLTYSTRPRGGVVHTLALSEALARRGHEVTVWTLGRGGDSAFFRAVDPAVAVRVVPFAAREGESVGDRIVRSLDALAAGLAATGGTEWDVVHAQDCISANAALRAGAAGPGGLLRTVHHLDEFTTPALIDCHERALTGPAALLAVSASVAGDVAAGWGREPTVIPNGVDAARFAAAAGGQGVAEWRAELGRYVLALGGIEPRKGSVDLLAAFAGLAPGTVLVFGGGETLFDYRGYREEFERRAAELGVTPVVLGTVPEERLAALVAGAAVLGFVSTKEGFGLAAMEALAAGVPVVARDLPVLREVFGGTVAYGSDVAGIRAALAAALAGEAPDPRPGRELAFSHSWDDVAASHEALYRSHASAA